jgi:hypothetical protein
MLRQAPPAVGPTGTAGRAWAIQELHSATRTTGRAQAAEAAPTSTNAHLGTAGRGTLWEPRAASGPEELRDSERTYASTHAYLGTAGHGTSTGTVGCGRAGRAA